MMASGHSPWNREGHGIQGAPYGEHGSQSRGRNQPVSATASLPRSDRHDPSPVMQRLPELPLELESLPAAIWTPQRPGSALRKRCLEGVHDSRAGYDYTTILMAGER